MVMSLASELRGLNLVHVTEGMIDSGDYDSFTVKLTPIGGRFADKFIEGKD
jgi:hypothetical protein